MTQPAKEYLVTRDICQNREGGPIYYPADKGEVRYPKGMRLVLWEYEGEDYRYYPWRCMNDESWWSEKSINQFLKDGVFAPVWRW